jgi:hypothetical protein
MVSIKFIIAGFHLFSSGAMLINRNQDSQHPPTGIWIAFLRNIERFYCSSYRGSHSMERTGPSGGVIAAD